MRVRLGGVSDTPPYIRCLSNRVTDDPPEANLGEFLLVDGLAC